MTAASPLCVDVLISVHAPAQVKRSTLRQSLFHRMSAVVTSCGVPGSSDALLRAEVANQLRLLAEDFSDEPLAAVFISQINAHYAARPGKQLSLCIVLSIAHL